MGLFSRKPKIKAQSSKREGFSGWVQCSQCNELIHKQELEGNCHCCPKCQYHYHMGVDQRLALLADLGSTTTLFEEISPTDPLQFADTKPYVERLEAAKTRSGHSEAVTVGTMEIEGIKTAFAIMNFHFLGGSMGSVVGERITRIIELAIKERLPLLIVSASGGARMQESILSLMQMAKTSAALGKLAEAKLPYISLLTNPTAGGVTASFAALGDIILAEPNALICFAGPRVIEQTLKHKLPPGAQRSEFQKEHGMVDGIVPRKELKSTLTTILQFLQKP